MRECCAPPGLGCGKTETGFLAEPKLGLIAPHPVQDDGELAGDRDAGPRHAAPLGNLHAPGTAPRRARSVLTRSLRPSSPRERSGSPVRAMRECCAPPGLGCGKTGAGIAARNVSAAS